MSRESSKHGSPEENPQGSFEFPAWRGEGWKTLAPGYGYNEVGEIVDGEGNTYWPDGSLKSTPMSPELAAEVKRLQKIRPELANNQDALLTLAKINLSPKKKEKRGDRYGNEDPNYH